MSHSIVSTDIDELLRSFPFKENLRGKTFLVSGATGLIGSILTRLLLEAAKGINRPPRIIALVRNAEKAAEIFQDSELLSIVEADLALPLPEIPGDLDFIIHTASPTASAFLSQNPVETILTIHNGTANLLELARRKKAEGFVFLSSLESYGISGNDSLITEDFHGYIDPMASRSSYPIAKLEAECLCHAYWKEYGVPAKVARLTQVFGAGVSEKDNRVFAQFARSVIEKRDIILHTTGESAKPYCYTTDAISAILHILFKGKPGEAYNVANPDTYISIRDLAAFVVENFGPQLKVRVELNDDMGYAAPTRLQLNTSKLKSLGWSPGVGLFEMFNRLIKYLS